MNKRSSNRLSLASCGSNVAISVEQHVRLYSAFVLVLYSYFTHTVLILILVLILVHESSLIESYSTLARVRAQVPLLYRSTVS